MVIVVGICTNVHNGNKLPFQWRAHTRNNIVPKTNDSRGCLAQSARYRRLLTATTCACRAGLLNHWWLSKRLGCSLWQHAACAGAGAAGDARASAAAVAWLPRVAEHEIVLTMPSNAAPCVLDCLEHWVGRGSCGKLQRTRPHAAHAPTGAAGVAAAGVCWWLCSLCCQRRLRLGEVLVSRSRGRCASSTLLSTLSHP